jgi:hypothetical protein
MTDPRIDTEHISVDALSAHVAAVPEEIFAILDPADDPRVLAKVKELEGDRAASLFDGYAAAKYVAIAPWLVGLDSERLAWLLQTPPGTPWGVLVESTADPRALRRQLQGALMARFPDGKSAFFRFYDPRILASFLAAATPPELAAIYGAHVRAFMILDAGVVKRWTLSGR